MPITKAPSRTVSRDSERHSLASSRTSSLRSDFSAAKLHSTGTKLKQKLITSSLLKHDDSLAHPFSHNGDDPTDAKRTGVLLNGQTKLDLRNIRVYRDVRTTPEASLRSSKQQSLSRTSSAESSRRSGGKSPVSLHEYDEPEAKPRGARRLKRTLSTSSSKSTPTRLSKNAAEHKKLTNGSIEPDHISHIDITGLNPDDDDDLEPPFRDIANLNEIPKTATIDSSLINGSSIATETYTTLTADDDADRNDEFRFKRSKRSHYKLQDSILGLISKYQSDLEHLDEKIKLLESQFFSNPPETTGLIKGWEGNVLNNAYANLSNGLKSRRTINSKFKANFTHTQNLITEHIFSLTSSTCAVSKMLMNN